MTPQPIQTIIDNAPEGQVVSPGDLDLLVKLAEQNEAPEPDPGDKVVHTGDDNVPAIARTKTTSAGYVNLRRNSDGKIVPVNRNQLADRMREKLQDGKQAWLVPNEPWAGKRLGGNTLCLLHDDHSGRDHMDELMLGTCQKRNILNGAALRRHMRRKHSDDWDLIQRDQEEQRQAARDESQRAVGVGIERVLGRMTGPKRKPRRAKTEVTEMEEGGNDDAA